MGLRSPLVGLAVRTACLFLITGASSALAAELAFTWSQTDVRLPVTPDGYTEAVMEGAWSSAAPGAPDLPWVPVAVRLERGESIQSWSFEPSGWVALRTEVTVIPAVDQAEWGRTGNEVRSEDPAFYETDRDYPAEPVRFTGVQSGSDNVTAGFLLNPFRWNPATGVLEMSTGGTLRWETESRDVPGFLTDRVRSVPYSNLKSIPSLSSSTAGRGAGAGTTIHALTGLGESRVPSLEGTPVEFLLVTTEGFAPAFQELIDWKNRSGIPAAIRTVEEIYAAYPQGIDRPEQIRLFLRDAYLYWGTRTVVIGGDPSQVPARYARDYSWNGLNGGTAIVTDLYYACLDGNWNANGNSLFGEPQVSLYQGQNVPPIVINTDRTDLRPELRVGRISCSTRAEAELYMRKYREYAIHPPQNPYLRDVLILGEVLFHSDWNIGDCDECEGCPAGEPCVVAAGGDGAEDGILLQEQLLANPAGSAFDFAEYYERDYWWVGRGRPNALPLDLESTVAEINNGVNIIFHSGHGDRDRWAIGPDRLEAAVLRSLTNGTSGPGWTGLVYSINCNSAAIDYDCSAEAWQFSPQGGGLIYVGSTNLDFPGSARKLQNLTFSRWPGDGNITPGDAYYFTVDSLAQTVGDTRTPDRFVLFSVAFLGDPDMPVWHDVPRTLSVSYPTEVTVGGGSASIVVRASGQAVPGARVALYKEGEALASGLTGSDGIVDLDFAPTSVGTFDVTVTESNAVPFQATGTVVAGGNAYVALTDFRIDDTEDEAAGISGNGDGVFDAGETVAVDLDFENHGNGSVALLQASLGLGAPIDELGVGIEILDAAVSLGPLASGASGTRARAFRLQATNLGGAADLQVTLPLEISWDQDGAVHAEEFLPNVYRSDLVMYSSTIVELDGDGDGIPEAGEDYSVGFDFLNLGLGSPHGLEVRVYGTPGGRADVSPPALSLVPAGPLGHVRTSDDFTVHFFWRHDLIGFFLEVWDVSDPENEVRVSKRRFDLIRPSAPSGLLAQGFRDRIVLGWKPVEGADTQGYRVYRADSAEGEYAPAGVGILPVASAAADSAYYADEGLPSLTSHFYRVAAVDSSGNESILSEPVEGITAPANLSGWPVTLNDFSFSAPSVEQLDSGGYEVVLGTDVLYAFRSDGRDYHDGDGTETTVGVLSSESAGFKFESKPAIYDIDGDGQKEIVAVSRFRQRGDSDRRVEITCFDRFGRVRWSQPIGSSFGLAAPAVGDIDGDGDPEVVTVAGRTLWAFHHDGRPFAGSGAIRSFPESEAFFLYGGVSLADVYRGPEASALEIMFVTRTLENFGGGKLHVIRAVGGAQDIPNFPLVFADYGTTADVSTSSPAVLDLIREPADQPALGEIIVTTVRDIWAVDPAGSTEPLIWRRQLQDYGTAQINPSPAIGDLDRDGDMEVVIAGGSGYLYVLDALTGTPAPAFMTGSSPYKVVDNARLGSAIIGDITGDQYPEIIIGSLDGRVFAFEHTGGVVRGFPFVNGGEVQAGLAMWDLNKDGAVELVIQAGGILPITVLEFSGTQFDVVNPDLGRYPWTQFRHDTRNTGNTMISPITPLALQAPAIEVVALRTVRLQWIAEEGFSQFQIHRRDLRFEDWDLVGSWRPIDLVGADGVYAIDDVVPDYGTYSYRLSGIEPDGHEVRTAESSIEVTPAALVFSLSSARPNPSGLDTSLDLSLPQASRGRVVVVDPAGRVLRVLREGSFEAGVLSLSWDGRDDLGRRIGAGVFFVRAEIDVLGSRSTKLIRLR